MTSTSFNYSEAVTKFAQALRRLRTARGLTLQQLGRLVNTSQQVVSTWECGRSIPAQVLAGKLALALECSLWDLEYTPDLVATRARNELQSSLSIANDPISQAHPLVKELFMRKAEEAADQLADIEITRIQYGGRK